MDPNATLDLIRDAYLNKDFEGITYHIEDLRRWLNGQGFAPTLSPAQLDAFLNMAQSYAGIMLNLRNDTLFREGTDPA